MNYNLLYQLLDEGLKNADAMHAGSMPGRGTTDTLLVGRRKQEKHSDKKKKLYMCFVDIEKAFNRVPKKVMDWTMRKKGLPKLNVRAVMTLYHGATTTVKMGTELTEEFLVKFGVHQGSVLSPLLSAIAVDVITENAREELMNKLL